MKNAIRREPAISAEQLHETIAEQIQQLHDTGQWQRFLDLTRGFHSYSLSNLLLILAQRPAASAVAGFRKWQEKGRQVRRGERGIRIFGYSTKKLTETDETTGEETTRTAARFPVLSVFDIDQTEPIDPANADLDSAALQLSSELTGLDDRGVVDTLSGWLADQGWTLTTRELAGTAYGFTDPLTRSVVLREGLAPAQHAKTLIHETAHIVLEHVADLDEYREHRGVMETEAESVAYVVAGMIGLNTAAYSIGYIAGWSGAETQLIRSTAKRVIAASHTIHSILDTAPNRTEAIAAA